ncbi:MAG TPA: SDR family oxidoreductase [Acidimicrobiia bacterium]|nr:SDR family oxidoreductase [Acidimicrobiia bacterium]
MERRTAFITGASRGIGKSCAIQLAKAGYDVAISARTVHEGEAREHSSTLKKSNTTPLPGSLEATAALVEAEGREAFMVPADLLDAASLGAAAARVLDHWGAPDVIVHNGRYIGPGHMDRFIDTPIELLQKQIWGNVLAPLTLNRLFLPAMIQRGGGIIVNITSASGYADPTKPAGEGGWGMGYGISKGAFQRVAGFLAVELGDQGIICVNVQPGLIATERIAADMGEFGIPLGAPADVVGVLVSWLATEPEVKEYNGKTIEAQYFVHERGLLPGWDGPEWRDNHIDYELAGARLAALEEDLKVRNPAKS